jgi:lantibiotic biosynthesis protein
MTAGRDRFLSAAAAIGRRLCRDAVWHEGRCNWLGWAMEPHGGQWVSAYRAMGALVYDGAAGIGLFLSRLARVTGDPIIATTAEGALAQALSAVAELKQAGEYGFYSGLAGVAQVCMASGYALEREDIVGRGKAAMAACAELEPESRRLDIINGSAGAIPALIDAAERFGREEFLMAAVRHGDHLMRVAARGDKGWSWDTLGMEGQPHLLGFAHGASGIAYALARVGAATDRRDFLDAAREGLRYERAYYRETEGNWPDLRSFVQAGPSGEAPCMIAWCHGAPGIGFARLALLPLLPDEPSVLNEAEIAVRTTAATLGQSSPGTGNFSLCHGDGGNADLLLFAADALGRPQLRSEAEAAAARALDRLEDARAPWPCGVPSAGESPNLMLGLAGIGYFFLRLYNSSTAPTVLLPSDGGKGARDHARPAPERTRSPPARSPGRAPRKRATSARRAAHLIIRVT